MPKGPSASVEQTMSGPPFETQGLHRLVDAARHGLIGVRVDDTYAGAAFGHVNSALFVMAGLVPAIHVFHRGQHCKDVDARDKPGHDGAGESSNATLRSRDPRAALRRDRDDTMKADLGIRGQTIAAIGQSLEQGRQGDRCARQTGAPRRRRQPQPHRAAFRLRPDERRDTFQSATTAAAFGGTTPSSHSPRSMSA